MIAAMPCSMQANRIDLSGEVVPHCFGSQMYSKERENGKMRAFFLALSALRLKTLKATSSMNGLFVGSGLVLWAGTHPKEDGMDPRFASKFVRQIKSGAFSA